LLFVEKALGQILFNPPNVAGWPGGKIWIDNATLTLRLNLPGALLNSAEVDLRTKGEFEDETREMGMRKLAASYELTPLEQILKGQTPGEWIRDLAAYFILAKPSLPLEALAKDLPVGERAVQVRILTQRLMSLPEYQMC
jgi:Protein of unknown function (DUF1800)